jgi:hypothetical protein
MRWQEEQKQLKLEERKRPDGEAFVYDRDYESTSGPHGSRTWGKSLVEGENVGKCPKKLGTRGSAQVVYL